MTYASDRINGMSPEKDEEDNLKAADEGGRIGYHFDNLYDQNESPAGDLIDEATGQKIDNSTDLGLGHLVVRQTAQRTKSQDMLGDVPRAKADEMANEWLKDNGLDWG
ncbi:MAG TPA: hypothetical protein VF996_03335 [Candidatus Saccharimonadales bacterium]|jgi:hypothetical protein